MRGIHTLRALSVMVAAIGIGGLASADYKAPRGTESKHDPDRLVKAQAKRDRKAAKALKGKS